MPSTKRLRVAIQKSGRLHDDSYDLLERCGLKIRMTSTSLFYHDENLPIDLLLVRDDDIPTLVFKGICDVAIIGENVLYEKKYDAEKNGEKADFQLVRKLNFGRCRLAIATPKGQSYEGPRSLQGKKIATSYPNLLGNYLAQQEIYANIIEISGSVEIAPRVGMADAICDLISTGRTLEENFLQEVEPLLYSQAVLVQGNHFLEQEKFEAFELLIRRIDGVIQAQESKYIMFHVPKDALNEIAKILPGCETPTVIALEHEQEKVAVHVVSREGVFWSTLEKLKDYGASSILVLPIEKMLP